MSAENKGDLRPVSNLITEVATYCLIVRFCFLKTSSVNHVFMYAFEYFNVCFQTKRRVTV